MFDFLRKTVLGAAAALALTLSVVASAPSEAAVIYLSGNAYTGSLAGTNSLGTIDLDNGAFVFSGVTGAATGSLDFTAMSGSLLPSATGAMQILIQAGQGSGITFTTLTFGGVAITLNAVTGGFAGTFSAPLPAVFDLAFTGANTFDSLQITIAAVPLPAGGLLLLGALGGLAALRRRKMAA
jgi:hypothetical protein